MYKWRKRVLQQSRHMNRSVVGLVSACTWTLGISNYQRRLERFAKGKRPTVVEENWRLHDTTDYAVVGSTGVANVGNWTAGSQ